MLLLRIVASVVENDASEGFIGLRYSICIICIFAPVTMYVYQYKKYYLVHVRATSVVADSSTRTYGYTLS